MKTIFLALILVVAQPAFADNYTHRASDTRKSA